jgi:ketosteroid isomerase-like protein
VEPSTVADKLALRDLVEAYASAVDRLDATLFQSLWTDDAVLCVHFPDGREPVELTGEAIAGVPARLDDLWQRTFHLVANHRVTLEGDEALGELYCVAHHVRGAGRVSVDHEMTIRYDDVYRRVGGEWRFARRDVVMLWTHDRTITGPIAARGVPAMGR